MVRRIVENEVREAPLTRERFQAADHGAAGEIRARALQGFGQQLGQVAKEVEDITYRFDVAAAKKADAEDAVELAKIRAEALVAVGTDAPVAAEAARAKAEEIKKRRLSELKGRRGELYMNSFTGRMAQFEESIVGHTVKQVDVAERGAAGARAETSLALAADGYTDPDIYQSNMATAESEYRRANKGTSPDQLARGWAIEKSKNHVNIVQQIMSDPEQADKAEQWIDDHATEIDPQQEPELRRMLRPALEAQEEDADFSRVLAFANGNPDATVPDDGEDDASAPTAVVPRPRGQPVRDVFNHVVGGKGRITNTATQHRLRGSGNGIDIAAPEGSPIRPPMSGVVLAEGWSEKGGWAMTVQHPNGKITGYAHMRARTPLRKGEQVDSTTVIGSVGSTGKSTGPHLHFTVRENGAKVDPQSVDWTVAGGGPGTIDPKTVKWKEGALPKPEATQNQLGSLLAATYEVATREGWSLKRFERATARIKQFAGTQEQLFNEKRQAAAEAAIEAVVALDNGAGLTDPRKQIPNFGLLDPDLKLRLGNMAAENNKPASEKVKAGGGDFLDITEASYNPAQFEAFLALDVRTIPTITPGERTKLIERQARMRAEGPKATSIDSIWGGVNKWFKPKADDKQGQANKVKLYDTVREVAERTEKSKGRPLEPAEVEQIVRQQVATVARVSSGTLWGQNRTELPRFLADKTPKKEGERDVVSIPRATRDQIIAAYRRRNNGAMPTSEQITDRYLRSLGR